MKIKKISNINTIILNKDLNMYYSFNNQHPKKEKEEKKQDFDELLKTEQEKLETSKRK